MQDKSKQKVDKSCYMKKAALHNLGCKVNGYETEAMKELLIAAGYEIVPFDSPADVYIVNTCTVTAIADKKSRQMLRRARRLNPDAVIVAAGCYVETIRRDGTANDAKRTGSVDDGTKLADIYIGNRAKDRLVAEIESFIRESNTGSSEKSVGDDRRKSRWVVKDIGEKACTYDALALHKQEDHTRAFLKIQDGCDRFCSYCKIPYARGRAVSRPLEDSLEEARILAEAGYPEIVLTGIHLSSYEINGIPALLDVVEGLQETDDIKRIRLSSLEPVVVTEDFAKRLSQCDKICPHFHLSLQSGCDKTLKAMNRRYTTDEFSKSVDYLRKYFDDPAITTDVIAGFPGESEEDFNECLNYVKRIGFYEMHVFPYSKREGTKAAGMPGHLNRAIREERAGRLIEAADIMSADYRKRYLDREAEVLIEEEIESNGHKLWTGFTREYIRVYTEDDKLISGQLIRGKLTPSVTSDPSVLSITRKLDTGAFIS